MFGLNPACQRQADPRHHLRPALGAFDWLPGLGQKAEGRFIQQRHRRRHAAVGAQVDFCRGGVDRDVGNPEHRSRHVDRATFGGSYNALVDHQRKAVAKNGGIACGIGDGWQGFQKPHIGVGEFVPQRQFRCRIRGQPQCCLDIEQLAGLHIGHQPGPRQRHHPHRPQCQQPVMADTVQQQVQRYVPPGFIGTDAAFALDPAALFDQHHLTNGQAERVEPQPQVHCPFGKADRFLKQPFGVNRHIRQPHLPDQRLRQTSGEIRQIGMAAGLDPQGAAVDSDVGKVNTTPRRIIGKGQGAAPDFHRFCHLFRL